MLTSDIAILNITSLKGRGLVTSLTHHPIIAAIYKWHSLSQRGIKDGNENEGLEKKKKDIQGHGWDTHTHTNSLELHPPFCCQSQASELH